MEQFKRELTRANGDIDETTRLIEEKLDSVKLAHLRAPSLAEASVVGDPLRVLDTSKEALKIKTITEHAEFHLRRCQHLMPSKEEERIQAFYMEYRGKICYIIRNLEGRGCLTTAVATKKLGAGGRGSVYHAEVIHDKKTHGPSKEGMALKITQSLRDKNRERKLIEEQRHEYEVLSYFHSNAKDTSFVQSTPSQVFPLYGVGMKADYQAAGYLAKEYREGDLFDAVENMRTRGGHPLDTQVIVRVIQEAAVGLCNMHAIDLVHRDIKPENIALEEGSDRKLHAVLIDHGSSVTPEMYHTGLDRSKLFGTYTPGYLPSSDHEEITKAYKKLKGDEFSARRLEIDKKRDVFALAMSAYASIVREYPMKSSWTPSSRLIKPTDLMSKNILRRNLLKHGLEEKKADLIAGILHSQPDERPDIEKFLNEFGRPENPIVNPSSLHTSENGAADQQLSTVHEQEEETASSSANSSSSSYFSMKNESDEEREAEGSSD